jgi:hypothetical protein
MIQANRKEDPHESLRSSNSASVVAGCSGSVQAGGRGLSLPGDVRAAENGTPMLEVEALDVLVQIMLNEKAPPNARVAAANTRLTAPMAKHPRSAPRTPKPLNGPST